MTPASAAVQAGRDTRFQSHGRWDGHVVLLCLGLVWLSMIAGFGGAIARRLSSGAASVPAIVHLHAVVFTAWLAGYTAQVLFVRRANLALHRKLGVIMAGAIGVLLVLGVLTAYAVQRHNAGTPASDPAFLSVQLGDLIGFIGLTAAAVVLRRDSAAHRRLMLLALLHVSTAGFARWLGGPVGGLFHFGDWGSSFWQTFVLLHFTNDLLILGLGAYDLATRGRLHPAYVAGVAWGFGMQALQVGLYVTPAWAPLARRALGL